MFGVLGPCSNDGFYFNDATSLTFCSNGNGYRLHCAPGTQNQAGRHFSKSYRDFCNVNLNDYGYGASKYGSQNSFSAGHGHGYQAPPKKPSYMPVYQMPPKKPSYKPIMPHQGYQPLKPRQHYPTVKVPVYMAKY